MKTYEKLGIFSEAFSLEGDIAGGEWQVVLTGALESGETEMRVYDYGVMLR